MSKIRFQHVFAGLLVLSAISAFAIPPQYSSYTNRVQPQVQGLFAPVARPSRAAAAWTRERLFPEKTAGQIAAEDVREENAALRARVAHLESQVALLAQRKAELEKLGPVGELCTSVAVV